MASSFLIRLLVKKIRKANPDPFQEPPGPISIKVKGSYITRQKGLLHISSRYLRLDVACFCVLICFCLRASELSTREEEATVVSC